MALRATQDHKDSAILAGANLKDLAESLGQIPIRLDRYPTPRTPALRAARPWGPGFPPQRRRPVAGGPGLPRSSLRAGFRLPTLRSCRSGGQRYLHGGLLHSETVFASQTGPKVTSSGSLQVKPLPERRQSLSIEESIEAVAGGYQLRTEDTDT